MAAPKIRQMRGPGMNKGLKKPRHGKFPKPETEEKKARDLAEVADNPSYLSGTLVPSSGKRRAPKGKVLSSKTF